MLLRDHLLSHAPNTRLVAVTVDHGLRVASADEAAAVARRCAADGIEHRILRWTDPKPAKGIPAAAREARYRLLAQAAREAGTDVVLTGHTADDQAETVSMRMVRGDGPGLAGMAPATLYDGTVWLLRPLLGQRRSELREFLRRQGVCWVEDATNDDLRFERPRVRARLAARAGHRAPLAPSGEGEGEIGSRLALARKNAERRLDIASRAAMLILDLAEQKAPGLLHLDPSFARHRERDAAVHALRVLLAAVGGSEFLPPQERAEAMLARLAEPPFRGTLARSLVAARGDGIWLARETRGLPGPQPVEDGAIWDGRFRLRVAKDVGGLRIAARSFVEAQATDSPDDGLPRSLVRAALSGQPVFLSAAGEALSGLPEGVSLAPVAAPYARFLPSFDLDLARAVNGLIGAPPIPAPPFQEHNESKA